ncbi:MAG: type II secretion system protein GspH [bacterium]|nr:type II secretion system protein GspH [bacterium]
MTIAAARNGARRRQTREQGMNRAAKAGFTLIELMVVVTLMLLMTAIGVPSFRGLYERSALQGAAKEFADALRYAQQRAILERNPIRLVMDVEKQTFWVPVEQDSERRHYSSRSRRSSMAHRSSRGGRERVREVKAVGSQLPPGFIFEFVYKVAEDDEIRRGEGEITFYPDGSADAAYITILRTAKEREDESRYFIKIDAATGMIKTQEGRTNQDGEDFYRGVTDWSYR